MDRKQVPTEDGWYRLAPPFDAADTAAEARRALDAIGASKATREPLTSWAMSYFIDWQTFLGYEFNDDGKMRPRDFIPPNELQLLATADVLMDLLQRVHDDQNPPTRDELADAIERFERATAAGSNDVAAMRVQPNEEPPAATRPSGPLSPPITKKEVAELLAGDRHSWRKIKSTVPHVAVTGQTIRLELDRLDPIQRAKIDKYFVR